MNSSWLTTSFQRVQSHPCISSTKHHTITFSTHDHRTDQCASWTRLNSGILTLYGWNSNWTLTLLKTDFYKVLQGTTIQTCVSHTAVVFQCIERSLCKKVHKSAIIYICMYQRWPFLRCHCCFFVFFSFSCLGGAAFFNFCFVSCFETLVRALSITARGKWGRESFPIWVGYLVFATFLKTGCEIKCFRCFFIPFTIIFCFLSSSSSLSRPKDTGGMFSCLSLNSLSFFLYSEHVTFSVTH